MDNQIKVASGISIVAAIWLILAPFILNYRFVTGAYWNDIVVGVIILVLAAVREWGKAENTNWASWISLVLGIWLIIAPFVIGYSNISAALWNDIIMGIVVAVLAGWSGSSETMVHRRA